MEGNWATQDSPVVLTVLLLLLSLTEPFIRMFMVWKKKKKNYPSLRQGLSNDVLNKDCEAAASLGSIMEKRKSEKNWPRNVFSLAHLGSVNPGQHLCLNRAYFSDLPCTVTWDTSVVLLSLKDAGWKSSFDTMYNGLPKQRQDSWMHTVSVLLFFFFKFLTDVLQLR